MSCIYVCTRSAVRSVGDLYVYPSWGNYPRNDQERWYHSCYCCAAPFCQTVRREDMATIVDASCGVFFFVRFFFTACPRLVTLTAPQTDSKEACSSLLVLTTTLRSARCRKHAQTATAVARGLEFVGCGNGGKLYRCI